MWSHGITASTSSANNSGMSFIPNKSTVPKRYLSAKISV